LTGAEDGHDTSAEALAAALANGQYVQLPGNHATAITAPQFETAMTGFLEGSSPASPARQLSAAGGPAGRVAAHPAAQPGLRRVTAVGQHDLAPADDEPRPALDGPAVIHRIARAGTHLCPVDDPALLRIPRREVSVGADGDRAFPGVEAEQAGRANDMFPMVVMPPAMAASEPVQKSSTQTGSCWPSRPASTALTRCT
jgi:hypothetical protein